eukprot:GILK01004245.1.p1 GENE.GILK01004245.1~~GILK01004245.1.p1  ORF type:complete len:885 (-),score=178.87 GILK01004245.1:497-3151(-)
MEESGAVHEKQAITSPSRKNSKTSPAKSNDAKYASIHRRVSVTDRHSEEDLLRLTSPNSSSSSLSQKHRRSSSDTSALQHQTPSTRTQSSKANKSVSPPSSSAAVLKSPPLATIDMEDLDVHAIAAENGMKLESETEVAIFKKAIATALSSPNSRLRESTLSPTSARQPAELLRFDGSKPPSFGPDCDAIFATAADPSQSSGSPHHQPLPVTPKGLREPKRSSATYSAPVVSKRNRQRSPDLKKNDNSAIVSLAPSTINTPDTAQHNNPDKSSSKLMDTPVPAPLVSPTNNHVVLAEASACPVQLSDETVAVQRGDNGSVSTATTTQEEAPSPLLAPTPEPESITESTADLTTESDCRSSSSPSPPPLRDVYMAVADVTADHLQQLAFELRTNYRKDSIDKGKNPSSESTRAQSPQPNQPSGTSERKLSDLSDTSALMRQLEELERTNSQTKSQADPRQRFKRKEMELVLQVLIGLINRYGEESVQLALTQVLGSEGTITPENIVDLAMNIRPELAKLEPLPILQAFEDEFDCYGSDIDGDQVDSEEEEDRRVATSDALADHIDSTEHVLPASFSSPDHKSSVYFRRIDDLELSHIDSEVDSETANARKDLATTLGLNQSVDFPIINTGQGPSVLHNALQESRNTLWFKQQVERLSRVPPLVRMNLMPVEHLLKSGLKSGEVQWHITLRPSNNTATTRIERELKQKQAAANHVNVISFDAYQRVPGPVKTANTAGAEPDIEPIQKPVRSTPSSAAHSRNPSNSDSVVIHDDVEHESFLNRSTTSTTSKMSGSSRRSAKSPKIEPLPSSTEHWVDWRKVKADLVAARAEKSKKKKEDKTPSRTGKQTTVAARRLSVGVSAETMWKYEAQIGKNGRRSAAPKASKV